MTAGLTELVAWRRGLQILFVGLIVAVALSACGTSTSAPSRSSSAPNPGLLKSSYIDHYPTGSVERTFLEYWSNMQFRSWADVAAYYDPRFRDYVGTTNLIGAKKTNAPSYPVLKPTIVRISTAGGDTTVYYTLTLADSSKELDSITWRKEGGDWQIVYDSRLDSELGQFIQNKVAVEKSGSLTVDPSKPPSPVAARAGRAAEQLQARFLQEELKAKAP